MGVSQSTSNSTQDAIQNISQSFSGECSFNCTNSMNDISVIIKDSNYTGNIDFEQVCSVDGQCQIASAIDATSSILFNASNSASASNSVGILPWPNFDAANASSYQNMRQNMTQSSNENCNLSSDDNMSNILVFMENTNFKGDIDFRQIGNVAGSCALNNSMDAVANATGDATNNAQSGKKSKSAVNLLEIGGIFILFIIFVVIIVAIIKAIANRKKSQ